MSGDQLDLDAIEARYEAVKPEEFRSEEVEDVPALVAEVRRLRALVPQSTSVAMPPPRIAPGATPFDVCTCVACGPPWRDQHPDWRERRLTSWMALCPTCGDKRCPGSSSHDRHPTP